MITIDPNHAPFQKVHSLFQGVIVPRPIAFVSSIDRDGNVNLSPFSFFNIFSTKPPILIFSPSRRGRDNTTKHTYENVLAIPEVTINIVNFNMVEQSSLASVEFPTGVNEFAKSGLTPVMSERVKPPRVGESPASFECKVNQVISLGDQGGAGNLVICEVLLAHFKEELLDDHGRIDPQKLDAVARMGNDYYCRVQGDSLFVVAKPGSRSAIGVDQLPLSARQSHILTGNDLGRLGNLETFPLPAEWQLVTKTLEFTSALEEGEEGIHRLAQRKIKEGKTAEALHILLSYEHRQ